MSLREKMDRILGRWAKELGEQGDVVISSRLRLARNLRGVPFPRHAAGEQLEGVVAAVSRLLATPGRDLRMLRLAEIGPLDRLVLVEKHLISPQLAENPEHAAVLFNEDETLSVMVNEEDHLRIQIILPGLQLGAAWRLADEADDFFEANLPYAFDEHKGYLTACPTNVGTGMRASVMLHLPALTIIDQARKVLSALAHLGFSIRGLYGEGSEAHGGIFQVSNQITLGRSEEEIVKTLMGACRQVIDHERAARQALLGDSKVQLEDRICRAFGTLTNSRLLSSEEALRLLSDVKLGIDLGLIQGFTPGVAKELFLLTRVGLLQKVIGKELEPGERDYYRAAMVRERLRAGRGKEETNPGKVD
ncbi:MAG: protein arginine kinase [Patescibacteria group bacterium]